ncbi:MAG TPA: hypothetical protein PKE31_17410 [Pseudomonadota bacterium]|nr:hypothetical protein [Pseudomonadota bacterium]
MRSAKLLFVGLLFVGACYKPNYSSDEDMGRAFRCYVNDKPSCPGDLVCCVGDVCGDALLDPITQGPVIDPSTGRPLEGTCVRPRPPKDMVSTPVSYWDFGVKGTYYTGVVNDPMLTGKDPDTGQWRCPRKLEPNDTLDDAVGLGSQLPIDPNPTPGTSYEICPDETGPDIPDLDVFKFKIGQPTKVLVRLTYKVSNGDLDVGLFRMAKDDATGELKPQRVLTDLTPVDNACLEASNLPPTGATSGPLAYYYVVVRGTSSPEKPSTYTMNNYAIRVYGVATSGDTCSPKKDGGT